MNFTVYSLIILIVISLPFFLVTFPKPLWKVGPRVKKRRMPFVIAAAILAVLGVINLIAVAFLGN